MASFISPYINAIARGRARSSAREHFGEVYVDAPLVGVRSATPRGCMPEGARRRDPQFTGISDPFEEPAAPEVHVDTSVLSIEESTQRLASFLRERGVFAPES